MLIATTAIFILRMLPATGDLLNRYLRAGSAYGDLDNDGDLDLAVSNVNGPTIIYKNNSKTKGVNISLQSRSQNTLALGSRVTVYKQGKTFSLTTL